MKVFKLPVIKVKFSFFCILLLLSFSASAGDFSLDFELSAGLRCGITGEYVYQEYDSSWEKLSYLEWEEKNLYPVTLGLTGGYKRFILSASLETAFSGYECGSMYDSDWVYNLGYKTNYSISENSLDSYLRLKLDFKYDFRPLKKLTLSPLSELEYSKISFNARDGYGWYGYISGYTEGQTVAWYDSSAKYYGKGSLGGIDYTQEFLALYAGFYASYSPIEKLHFNLFYLISPYTHFANKDRHWYASYTSGDDYADIIDSYFKKMKGGVSVFYDVTPRISAGLSVEGSYTFTSLGDSYYKSSGSSSYTKYSDSKSGADGRYFIVSLSTKVKIF